MIDELELATGGHDRDEARNGVDDQPKTLGAESESVFGARPVLEVGVGAPPVFGDFPEPMIYRDKPPTASALAGRHRTLGEIHGLRRPGGQAKSFHEGSRRFYATAEK
jgi:hypothetical protein